MQLNNFDFRVHRVLLYLSMHNNGRDFKNFARCICLINPESDNGDEEIGFAPRVIRTNSLSGFDGQIYWGLSYWGQRWRIYLCSVLSSVVRIYNLRLKATQDVQLWLHKATTLIPSMTFFLTSCLPYQAVGDCFNLLGTVFHTKSNHQPKIVLGNLKCVIL